MTRALALLRPEPGWSASADAARAAGIEVVGHPLSATAAVAWEPPQGKFDALLVGSAAAIRLGGDALAAVARLPVHAVGEATAMAARAAGFRVGQTGEGGLQALLDSMAGEPRHFLRLAGEERVSLRPNPGQVVTEVVVYRMVPRPVTRHFATLLNASRPLVALHSAATAAQFAREIERLGLARRELSILALGPRIAEAAGTGWAAVHIAPQPSDAALLAKASALCK